jgi:hypothetical protein
MEISEDYVLKSEKPLLIHFDGEPLQLDTNEIRIYQTKIAKSSGWGSGVG